MAVGPHRLCRPRLRLQGDLLEGDLILIGRLLSVNPAPELVQPDPHGPWRAGPSMRLRGRRQPVNDVAEGPEDYPVRERLDDVAEDEGHSALPPGGPESAAHTDVSGGRVEVGLAQGPAPRRVRLGTDVDGAAAERRIERIEVAAVDRLVLPGKGAAK